MTTSQRITRSRTDRLVSGVCGGLARYFGLDTVIVRGVFVVLGLINMGIMAIAYLVAVVLLSEESEAGAANQPHPGWRFDPWTGERVNASSNVPAAPSTAVPPAATTPPASIRDEQDDDAV
jgi:phage shock protein C